MTGVPNPAHTTALVASPSSNPSTNTTQTTQDYEQARSTQAVVKPHSNNRLSDTDDELSDAPESPVWPGYEYPKVSPTPPRCREKSAPPSDSNSDLSLAPDSPVYPGDEYPKASPAPPRCTEKDCVVKKAVRRHNQGPYLHGGKPPRTTETLFGESNPPPLVWKSWMKIQARDPSSTVEDDMNVLGFLRYHVDNPNTDLMGI